MTIDLSLNNTQLYSGCDIETVAGRLNLTTSIAASIEIVGGNVNDMLSGVTPEERDEVVLTGPMAVWAYLIVFHAVVHRFRRVLYDDGRSGPVLVAAHG